MTKPAIRRAMERAAKPAIALISGSIAIGCGGTSLPPRRPADFRVEAQISGGMLPEWTQMSCEAPACVYLHKKQAVGEPETLPVTDAQLDALYRAVREHRFDRIRIEKHGIVYDAGGTTIIVRAGGKTWSFGASATESVAEGSRADFDATFDALGSLIAELRKKK
jgi:hypothetical protein